MSKHTPLPWRLAPEPGCITDQALTRLIARVEPLGKGDMLANAEFIVRACNAHNDMLAAVEATALLDQWRHSPEWLDNPSCRVDLNAAIDSAQAAIAKAGEWSEMDRTATGGGA